MKAYVIDAVRTARGRGKAGNGAFADVPQEQTASSSSAWRTLALTSVAVFVVSLDGTVLFVAFPSIRTTFAGVSAAQLSWVLNAYTIVFGALLVPAGRIADRIGRKRIFLLALVLFTCASALCGLAPTTAALIAARALQALGAALLLPSSLALVLHAFPMTRRATAVALWGAVGALAAAIGPSLGSLIIQSWGWRWVFYVNVPVCIAAVIRGSRSLLESRDEAASQLPDALGIALLIAGVALFALGIVQGSGWGLTDSRTLASVAGGSLLLAGFVLRSRRAASPTVDLSLFEDRTYRLANLATFVFAIAFTAMFFNFVFFLTQRWHYTLFQAGLAITPGPLVVAPVAIIAGRIADRRGHRAPLVVGGLVFALGGALLYSAVNSPPDFLATWMPRALVTGTGVGLVLPSLSGSAVHGLPSNRFALGSAINQAVRQIGSVIGVGLVIALLGTTDASNEAHGFRSVAVILVAGGVLTSLVCLGIKTGPRASQLPPANQQEWAVVTGASSGIGRAFARELARRGHPVLIVARRSDALQRVTAEIAASGGRAEPLVADLASAGGVEAVARAADNLGDVGVLVNNAGAGSYGPFLDQPVGRDAAQVALNIDAVVGLTRRLLPRMVTRRRGQIINVASILAFMPTPYFATYAATKAFVLSFSEALAHELRGTGVRILAASPGVVKTGFSRVAGSPDQESALPKLTPEAVVRATLRAAESGRVVRVVGPVYRLLAVVAAITPRPLMRWLMGRIFGPGRPAPSGQQHPIT